MAVFEVVGESFPRIHILTDEGDIHPLYPNPVHFYALRVDTGTMARRFNLPEGMLTASIRAHPDFGERIVEVGPVAEEETVPPTAPDPPAEQAPDIPPDDQGDAPEDKQAADVVDAVLGDLDSSPAPAEGGPPEGEASQPASPSLTCEKCGKVYRNPAKFAKHMRAHEAE